LLPLAAHDRQEAYLRDHFVELFELELGAWVPDRRRWPEDTSYETFCKWFDFEFYALVVDASEGELTREPYG